MKFIYDLTPSEEKIAKALSRAAGQDVDTWLNAQAQEGARRALRESNSLSLKQVAAELDVHPQTAWRYYTDGMFPNAYKLSQRTIRVPLTDVRKAKKAGKVG